MRNTMYERLTEKRKGQNVIPLRNSVCGVDMPKWALSKANDNEMFLSGDVADRLCEIEDKICEGRMVELPCKVGDTLWKIEDVWHLDDRATWKYHYEKEILEFRVRSISISCNSKGIWTKKFRICEVKNGKTIDKQRNIEFADYGKSVFLTPEEANKKLKELENED